LQANATPTGMCEIMWGTTNNLILHSSSQAEEEKDARAVDRDRCASFDYTEPWTSDHTISCPCPFAPHGATGDGPFDGSTSESTYTSIIVRAGSGSRQAYTDTDQHSYPNVPD
jgi:hypothetical protein